MCIRDSSYSYNYGNDITQNFTTPATYNNFYVNGGQRTISDNYGKQFYFGVRPYIGVEYFFAPKMSLSGEFGYQIYYSTMTNRTQTREYWDGSVGGVRTVTDKMTYNGHGSFSAGIDNLAGFITLQFYF